MSPVEFYLVRHAIAADRGEQWPDDIKRPAVAVLGHRMILKPEARLRKRTAAHIVDEILMELPAPVPAGKEGEEKS